MTLPVFGSILRVPPAMSTLATGRHPASVIATPNTFTLLIIGRLAYYQRRSQKLLGNVTIPQYTYTRIIIMIIEAASINISFQLLEVIFAF
jgi:hypothetical protein